MESLTAFLTVVGLLVGWPPVLLGRGAPAGVSGTATLLFSDGWEDGTLGTPDEGSYIETVNSTVSTLQANTGTHSLRYVSGLGGMVVNLGNRQQVYIKFWWYPDVLCPLVSGAHYWRIGSQTGGSYVDGGQQDAQHCPIQNLTFWPNSGNTHVIGTNISNATEDAWNKYEMFFKLNDSGLTNGVFQVWLNNVLQVDYHGDIRLTSPNNITNYQIITNWDDNPKPEWYFDDLEIWTDIP